MISQIVKGRLPLLILPWLRLTQMSLKRRKTNLWRIKNKFSLKIAKTEIVFTGTRQRIRLPDNQQIQIHIEAKNISPWECNFLGFSKRKSCKTV